MRSQRRRKKKLRVAFQFQFSNQAAWKCDVCRKSGLERQRRCGWLPEEHRGPSKIVWARNGAGIATCPKSYISAESLGWLEEFAIRHTIRVQPGELAGLPARTVDALCILEKELAAEKKHARRD